MKTDGYISSVTLQRVEDFFSRDITHLITLQNDDDDKENKAIHAKAHHHKSALGSPIRLKGRYVSHNIES